MYTLEAHVLWSSVSLLIVSLILFGLLRLIRWSNRIHSAKYSIVPGKGENHLLPYIKWLKYAISTNRFSTQSMLKRLNFLFKSHQKSGICSLNFPFLKLVFLYRPEVVKLLLGDSRNNSRSLMHGFMNEWLGTSLIMRDGEEWKQRRKLLTPTFHFRILESFLRTIEKKSEILVQTFENCREEFTDVSPVVTDCIVNILYETSMGLEENSFNNDYLNFYKSLSKIREIIQLRIWQVHLWPDFLFQFSQRKRELSKNIKTLRKITEKIVREKSKKIEENVAESEEEKKDSVAFLDLLLNHTKTDPNFTIKDICDEVQLFLFAGHDTTAFALSWAIYLLGKHKNVQEKVRDELDHIIGDNPLESITKEELLRMKYLESVIKETLRLYPSVPFLARTLTKDLFINDYKISKGSTCVIPVYFMHGNPEIFPNPKTFDPDRFLPQNSSEFPPYSYIPFSAGQRNCIGQKFAMMEMKMILAKLLRHFTLQSSEESIDVSYNLVSSPDGPLRVKMTPRSKQKDV